MSKIIETTQLCKSYGKLKAIDHVELSLSAGPPIGLVGPNGAGKTTLMSLLCGFLKPDTGNIQLLNLPPLHQRLVGQISILPQDASLKFGISILKQLYFLAELQGYAQQDAKKAAHEVLDQVGLMANASKGPEKLSHGMLKRVAIAQSLLGSPKVCFLDEPTAGLDPNATRTIHDIIHARKHECTFIISSHNLDEIQGLCESVLVINNGKIANYDKMSNIVRQSNCLTFHFSKPIQSTQLDQLTSIPGVNDITQSVADKCQMVIYYDAVKDEDVEIALLKKFKQLDIQFTQMSRGEALADKVIELMR